MKTSKEEWKMTTEITKLLGIKYPINSGWNGMGGRF